MGFHGISVRFPYSRLALALSLLFQAPLHGQEFAQDLLRRVVEARDKKLTDQIEAKYSVRVKRLPGMTVWLKKMVENGQMQDSESLYQVKDNEVHSEFDCSLQLSGNLFKLGIVQPRVPLELVHQFDGTQYWAHSPKRRSANILSDRVSLETLAEQQPFLPAYLSRLPDRISMHLIPAGPPSLSALLSKDSPYHSTRKTESNGHVTLEFTRPGNWPNSVMVRRITLDPKLGYAPVRYVSSFRREEISFPLVEITYDDHFKAGSLHVPRVIKIVSYQTANTQRPEKGFTGKEPFEIYAVEETTVEIQDLKPDAKIDKGVFKYDLPPETVVVR